jgi:hypothetical protein
MMRASGKQPRTSEGAIFAGLWENGDGGLSPSLARHLLRVGFAPADKQRMHERAVKNQESRLSTEEQGELDCYVKVADLLAILQSKARQILRGRKARG